MKKKRALKTIMGIIEQVDIRCMAADGPVARTKDEITDDELRQIYEAAKAGLTEKAHEHEDQPTTKVRIAVATDQEGFWAAFGRCGDRDRDMEGAASADLFDTDGAAEFGEHQTTFIEAEVPMPKVTVETSEPTTVQAVVKDTHS